MTSVQERLQQTREHRRNKPVRLPFPGFADESLVVIYKPVTDWQSARAQLRASVRVEAGGANPTEEVEAAADTLLRSCQGCEAHIEGEVHALPHKLGVDLAEYLGFDVKPVEGSPHGMTDRQAVFIMVEQTVGQAALMEHYDALVEESRHADGEADQQVAGESPAS